MATAVNRLRDSLDTLESHTEVIGKTLVEGFQMLALFVIGATVVWSAIHAYWSMVLQGVATVEDILLLFVCLELGAMVGIYFQTNRLPVQLLIYVAITILTRSLASSLKVLEMDSTQLLSVTGDFLILAAAVLVLRYASHVPPFISHVDAEGPDRRKSEEALS